MQEILFTFRWKVFDFFFTYSLKFCEIYLRSIIKLIVSLWVTIDHFIFEFSMTIWLKILIEHFDIRKKNLEKIYVHKYIIFMCANIADLMISVFESGICIRSFHIICSLNLEWVSSREIRRIIITKWWSQKRIFHCTDIVFHVQMYEWFRLKGKTKLFRGIYIRIMITYVVTSYSILFHSFS